MLIVAVNIKGAQCWTISENNAERLRSNLPDEACRTSRKNRQEQLLIHARDFCWKQCSEYGVLNDKIVVRPSQLGGCGIFGFDVETKGNFQVPLHTMIAEEKSNTQSLESCTKSIW